jgi:hypothetical protein
MTDETGQPVNAAPKSRARLVMAIAAVIVLALAGAGIHWATSSGGLTVTGTLELSHREDVDGHCDTGLPGFTDIRGGAQIVVTDGEGKTLAIGRLGTGTAAKKALCLYGFTIEDVPGDADFYAIEVAHRGKVQYSRADLDKPIRLSVG